MQRSKVETTAAFFLRNAIVNIFGPARMCYVGLIANGKRIRL